MRTLTSIKPLQHFLENRLTRHVKGLSTDDRDLLDTLIFPVSDCCQEDYYTEGYNTVCSCCGFNCELIKP